MHSYFGRMTLRLAVLKGYRWSWLRQYQLAEIIQSSGGLPMRLKLESEKSVMQYWYFLNEFSSLHFYQHSWARGVWVEGIRKPLKLAPASLVFPLHDLEHRLVKVETVYMICTIRWASSTRYKPSVPDSFQNIRFTFLDSSAISVVLYDIWDSVLDIKQLLQLFAIVQFFL